jgi:hypothetical protein
MFVIEALGVFTAAFAMSALVAEAAMRSQEERELAPAVRAGFGYFIALAFFCGAWQFVTIGWAWLAGIVLVVACMAARGLPSRESLRGYARAYLALLALAAVYFLPLAAAGAFGPFTEGGGDISIYADTAKYLVDHGLTEAGLPTRDLANAHMNPPFADYSTYRVLAAGTMSDFLYTPYAMFTWPSSTNYAAFHGVQSAMYAFLVAGCWAFFRRHGRAVAILGAGFAVASHGLVSVFYNTYSAQAISLASCALMLAAVPRVVLLSWAGLRTYGCVLLLAWACYVHYLAVLAPLALAAKWGTDHFLPRGGTTVPPCGKKWSVPDLVFLALLASVAWTAARKSWELGESLLRGALSAGPGMGANPYMGEPVAAWSAKWFAFLFGFVSQQHVQPLAAEIGAVDVAMRVGIAAGLACVALGLVVMMRAAASGAWRDERRDAAVYAISLLTIAAHVVLVRQSMYTQAKGAQNVLPLVYAVMLVPIAFAARRPSHRWAARILIAAAAIFLVLLLVPRAAYFVRFAGGFDRTTILEPSYFDEAARIRREDPDPFVILEPRVPADMAAASQPFFGARMLPSRHIILKKHDAAAGPYGVVATVPDFIGPEDLAHLWTLRARREPKWEWLQSLPLVAAHLARPPYRTTWHAERLASARQPTVILSGELYERAAERTARSAVPISAGAPAGFAALRKGSVSVFIPANTAARITLELRPATEVEYGADAKITDTGDALKLEYAMPAASHAAFRVVARCMTLCLLRVHADGKDVD